MKDSNGNEYIDGSIIDIHQTVNGYRYFYIKTIDPLDIRYAYDTSRKYEYDKNELITPSYLDILDVEIIGNLKNAKSIEICTER